MEEETKIYFLANSKDRHIEQGNFLKHEVPIQVNILYCLHTTCCIAGTVDWSVCNMHPKDSQTTSALRLLLLRTILFFCLFLLTSTSKITIVFEHKF